MPKKILIVDDSVFVYQEMKQMLANSDYRVIGYAKTGEEALEMYPIAMPDIVTLDIIMPGMDGLETAEILLKKWPNANVIIVSSLAYDETMEQAKKIGAKGFIFKPVEEDSLIQALDCVTFK